MKNLSAHGSSTATLPCRFLRRVNRFLVEVERDGVTGLAHLPNSGRMQELLVKGRPAWLVARPGPGRSTAHDLLMIEYQGRLVGVDTRLPNAAVAAALEAGTLPELDGWKVGRREARLGNSRLDFELRGPQGEAGLLEVKSVNLVQHGVALFPDAPTLRGARHLAELAAAQTSGIPAWVLFVIQRPDAVAFAAHRAADPAFADALGVAAKAGVGIMAYRCRVRPDGLELLGPVSVRL